MRLAYPYMLLFLPLLYLLARRRAPQPAVIYPSVTLLKGLPPGRRARLRGPMLSSLLAVFAALLCLAAARPQKLLYRSAPVPARNIMLVLDASGSMERHDFELDYREVSRLDAVKRVVASFIDARRQDRIGLVVFGSRPYLQAPLTRDRELVKGLLASLQVGIAGDKTALGDALALGLKRAHQAGTDGAAVILLTDGVSNAGRVAPHEAGEIARSLGIKVHTIGIGALHRGPFDRRHEGYDAATLGQLAERTGGVYFNAADSERLDEVYRAIDALERTAAPDPGVLLIEERYGALAGAALAALLLYALLAYTVFLRVP